MKISCEERKCRFWNGKNCTDEIEYINAINGGLCCRYHPNAMLKEDYEIEFGSGDIDDILPSECEGCGYRLSAIENTPKEITINYLESIKKEKQNILYNFQFSLALLNDVTKIDRVIEIVKESEGE